MSRNRSTTGTSGSTPIHVCHVGPYPARGGGISAVTASLVERQRQDAGLVVETLPTSVDGGRRAKTLAFARALLRLRRRLGRSPRPLLHVHASTGTSFRRKAWVLGIARRRGVPCLLHVHSGRLRPWYDDGPPRRRAWIRRQFARASRVIALSESWKTYLSALTDRPIEVIPNAVDAASLHFDRDYEARTEFRLLLLGGVGLVGKGALELIDVVDALRRRGEIGDVRLSIVGHGEVDQVRDRAARLGLSDVVRVTGWIGKAETRALLRDADVFVLPSHAEGLPVSMLEAMATGLPVIVTPVGGIPEAVRDGQNGLVVPPRDPDALQLAIRGLATEAGLRRRLGEAARATIRERFDLDTAVARFREVYREVSREADHG